MKWSRYWAIGIVVLAVLVSFISSLSFGQGKVKNAKEGYVGVETCKGCHPEVYDLFQKDPHRGKECESCHGPGAKHAEASGQGLIFSFKGKGSNPRDRSDACLSCHEKQKIFFQSTRGVHQLSAVSCDECHQVHTKQVAKKLLKQKDPDLCFSCHGDVKAKFYLPNNHRVIQGALKCTDCHTPHGTRTRASLRKVNKFDTDVCYKCHPEKRGPWVFEHQSQKFEGCSVCHSPHGSPNRFLLIRSNPRALCMECHGQPHFAKFACTNCHTQIHGSNFSSRFLQ